MGGRLLLWKILLGLIRMLYMLHVNGKFYRSLLIVPFAELFKQLTHIRKAL
jgi:hypothetical protein